MNNNRPNDYVETKSTGDELCQPAVTTCCPICGEEFVEGELHQCALSSHAVLADVRAFLEKSRMNHRYCEDSWYSCPKAEDGCANDAEGEECNCGADKYNEELDALLQKISEHFS